MGRAIPGSWFPVRGLQARAPSTALGDAIDAIQENRYRYAQLEAGERRAREAAAARAQDAKDRDDERARIKDDAIVAHNQRLYAKAVAEMSQDTSPVAAARVRALLGLHGVGDYGASIHQMTADEMMSPAKTGEQLVGRPRPVAPAGVDDMGPAHPGAPPIMEEPEWAGVMDEKRAAELAEAAGAPMEKYLAEKEAFEAQGGEEGMRKRLLFTMGPGGIPLVVPRLRAEYDRDARKYDEEEKAALAKQETDRAAERKDLEHKREWKVKLPSPVQGGGNEELTWSPFGVFKKNQGILQTVAEQEANALDKSMPGSVEGVGANAAIALTPGAALHTTSDKRAEALARAQSEAAKREAAARNARRIQQSQSVSSGQSGARLDLATKRAYNQAVSAIYAGIDKRFGVSNAQTAIRNIELGLDTLERATKGDALAAQKAMTAAIVADFGKTVSNMEGAVYRGSGGIITQVKNALQRAINGGWSETTFNELRDSLLAAHDHATGLIAEAAEAGRDDARRDHFLGGDEREIENVYQSILKGKGGSFVDVGSGGGGGGTSRRESTSESLGGDIVGQDPPGDIDGYLDGLRGGK